ncbi:MAG: SGNH/GDSL hydrolase family protein, partial [Pyrinomonadaceae bacterium]
MDDLQPKLSIIWVGTNDNHHAPTLGINQVSLETWYANLDKIVTKAKQYGDCLIVYPMASQDPNIFSERPYPNVQSNFERVARYVASNRNCGFISIHQAIGSWARNNSLLRMTDSWHLNQAGHNVVNTIIKGVLSRNF